MDEHVKRTIHQPTKGFCRLGKEIKISPKAHLNIQGPGYRTEYFENTICIDIGIGKDHTATFIMSEEAWEALKAGAKVHITTTEEYKKKYIYGVRTKKQ